VWILAFLVRIPANPNLGRLILVRDLRVGAEQGAILGNCGLLRQWPPVRQALPRRGRMLWQNASNHKNIS